MMTVLHRKEILEIIYGSQYLGGGGSMFKSFRNLAPIADEDICVELYSLDEMKADEYAVMVAILGAPTKTSQQDSEACICEAVRALCASMEKEGKHVKYLYSGEIGGSNTFVPIQAAIRLGMPMVDVDGQGRAVPEINTGLGPVYDVPVDPCVLANANGDVMDVHLKDPLDACGAEKIARQMCQAYGSMLGFSTWMADREQLNRMVPGAITQAMLVGRAILKAKEENADPFALIGAVTQARELFRGEVISVDSAEVGGFDVGTAVVRTAEGAHYEILFQNESILAREQGGRVLMTVPETIAMIDLDTYNPMDNCSIKPGMRVSVAGLPASPNWWKTPKGFACWQGVLARVGYHEGPVRY